MYCVICKNICNTNNDPNNKNIGITLANGTVICLLCYDISDFLTCDTTIKQLIEPEIELTKKPIKENNVESLLKGDMVQIIKCPKCKNKFNTKQCKCGYKNPLMR